MITRPFYFLLMLVCCALIGGALYYQWQLNELPCPLCIMQRYAYLAIALCALFTTLFACSGFLRTLMNFLIILCAFFGAGAAAYQIWKQNHPDFSCGADSLGIWLNQLPFAQWLPEVFKADGSCSLFPPKLWNLSLPLWSLIGFILIVLTTVLISLIKQKKAVS